MNYKIIAWLSLFAVAVGGCLGYFFPSVMLSFGFIGQWFINGLQLLVLPVIFLFVITGISAMKDKGKIKRSFRKTGLYFLAVSFTASLFGLLMAFAFQPGVGIDKSGAHIPEDLIPHLSSFSINSVLSSMLPSSFIEASISVKLFGILLIAILLGTVLSTFNKKYKIVTDFFDASNEILKDVLKYVQYLIPIGILSLAGTTFALYGNNGVNLFSSLFMFTLVLIFSFSFYALVILPLGMRIYTQKSAYALFSRSIPALTTAFASNSQAITLPVTKSCIEDVDTDERAGSFILPLGAIFNSCATALFLSASTVFLAQMYDVSLSIVQIVSIVFVSMLISFFSNFIPYTSLLILALTLELSNIPIHVSAGIGILVIVDFLFVRLRTVVNVWSDIIGAAILAETFDFKTAVSVRKSTPMTRRYDSKTVRKTDKPRKKYESKTKSVGRPTKSVKKEKVFDKTKKDKPIKKADSVSKVTKPVKPAPAEKVINKSENSKPFEMPPVPYHILETELKPRTPKNGSGAKNERTDTKEKPVTPPVKKAETPRTKKVEPKKSETKKTEDDSVITKANNILSQDTIKRERDKIAAQLNSMRERESKIKIVEPEITVPEIAPVEAKEPEVKAPVIAPVETKIAKEKTVSQEKVEIKQTQDEPHTRIDFVSSELEEKPLKKPEKKELELETVAVTKSEDEKVQYGRSKSKKGDGSKSEESATSESTSKNSNISEKPEGQEFSKENMSFGRSKRKK